MKFDELKTIAKNNFFDIPWHTQAVRSKCVAQVVGTEVPIPNQDRI